MSNKTISKNSLGDRMKGYENVTRTYLTRRMSTIIRLDGSHFHSYCKGFEKPFDMRLVETMWDTAKYLCANIMGCKLAYVQSDEISLLLTDYDTLTTEAWFDKNIQKMVSVSASMATMAFNRAFIDRVKAWKTYMDEQINGKTPEKEFIDSACKLLGVYEQRMGTAMFDSRVFVVPDQEVCNYFIFRQQDATRNSIQMLGQANFSHKQLHSKSCNVIQDMLFTEKGINFNDLPTYLKRGACIIKEKYMCKSDFDGTDVERSHWVVDEDIPIFTQDREYIEQYVKAGE